MSSKVAIIIGAGPAGLTAAYELLKRTDIKPVVLEANHIVGGIAQTENYKGNRIDIGGHRFFSKSDRVMNWWLEMMPLQKLDDASVSIAYQRKTRRVPGSADGPDPETVDRVMLLRQRRSRIYYLRRFFDYPISLSVRTLSNLGVVRVFRIGVSYVRARLFPIRGERTLEEFFINRFGRELYATFFRDYTEKVWGVPCREISAEWGAQRIKGLSIWRSIVHALRKPLTGKRDVAQKGTETSLIEQFLYPKLGPGLMWETCTTEVRKLGGEVRLGQRVIGLQVEGNRIVAVEVVDAATGNKAVLRGELFFSTMPIRDLVRAMNVQPPEPIRQISDGLVYRDFITVGLLLKKLSVREHGHSSSQLRDNWIYIQEPDVRVGRLQIFNNWSPYMVADRSKVWLGLEYFCNEGDDLWTRSNEQMIALAKQELAKIGIIEEADVLDATVIRMPKAYPAYFGTYNRFDELRAWLDGFENLYLIGRNGMHRYNNQDHSMLAAMTAVDNIVAGVTTKDNLWSVNAEQDYHEEGSRS
jgi:protoporphyrinogen oxidase